MSHDASHDASHSGCASGGSGGGHGHYDGTLDGANRPRQLGISTTDDLITVELEFHRACDLLLRFKELARKEGLVPIDAYWPNLMKEDTVKDLIVDNDAWNPPDDEKIMVSGWYPGATGWTRMWKEYWQLGKRRSALHFWEPLGPDHSHRSFLEISCVTWYFAETADFRTRLTIKVETQPMWWPRFQRWVYDGPDFDLHMKPAQRIADGMLRFLQANPQHPGSEQMRLKLKRDAEEAARPKPPAPFPGVPVVVVQPDGTKTVSVIS